MYFWFYKYIQKFIKSPKSHHAEVANKFDCNDIVVNLNSSHNVIFLVLKMVSFHNTMNYLTKQINNETSFETQ